MCNKPFDMLNYIRKMHAGQKRKGGGAYFKHPYRVYKIMQRLHAPESVCLAALAHDVIEDTIATFDSVKNMWGSSVARYVDALTKYDNKYYSQVEERSKADPWIIILKLADRADNLETIGCFACEKIMKKVKKTEKILLHIGREVRQYMNKRQTKAYVKIKDVVKKLCEELRLKCKCSKLWPRNGDKIPKIQAEWRKSCSPRGDAS